MNLNLMRYRNISEDFQSGDWIFSRTACLGNEVSSLITSIPRWNIQKGRLDHLNAIMTTNPSNHMLPRKIFANSNIYKIVRQEWDIRWLEFESPKFVLLDSFSDLTDLQFTLSKKTDIYCHAGDLKSKYIPGLENHGRLNLQEYSTILEDFISNIRQLWGSFPVFYIHYPVYKEYRRELIERAEAIRVTTTNLANFESNFINIYPDEKIIAQIDDSDDDFPYHFGAEVKKLYARSIVDLI